MLFRSNEYDPNVGPFCQELYDRSCKIHYRIAGRNDVLVLDVKICLIARTDTVGSEKLLKITITDDKNPLFLYTTEVDSQIYSKLKQKLDLVIDFAKFPDYVVNLMEQCVADSTSYRAVLEEVQNDPCNIVEGKCILFRIKDVNRFQELTLVALHVVAGSETEVNALMARNVVALKKQIESMQIKCRNTEERYAKSEQAIKMKHYEMEQLKNQTDEQIRSNRLKLDEEINLLKRNCESIQLECDRRIRKALNDQEDIHKTNISSLENTVDRLKAELSQSRNANAKLETEIVERNERLEKFHNDMKILQDEILRAENKIGRLETESKEKNIFVVNIKQKCAQLEKERDDRDKQIRKLSASLEVAESSKNYLKNVLKEKFDGLEKKERDFATLSKDLSKANEIISKMNKEINNLKHKLGERTTTMVDLQKSLDELKSQTARAEVSVKEMDEKVKGLEGENVKLKDDLLLAQDCIKTKEELIKKNERIIGWLNDIVGKQGTSGRPDSSSSKSSGVSTMIESTCGKFAATSLSKRLTNGTDTKASLNQKKTTVPKTKPDFRTY